MGAALTSPPSIPFPTPESSSSPDSRPPQFRLNALLAPKDGDTQHAPLTVAAAESCTGGEVSHRITEVAGSSGYFLGGIVSYSNSAKASLLGVPQAVLDNPGAVSEPCARAMAEGARRALGADIAVATTGIAGPGGGSARKPVGLVYIAVSGPAGSVVAEHRFSGDRRAVMDAAASEALDLLLRTVQEALQPHTPDT